MMKKKEKWCIGSFARSVTLEAQKERLWKMLNAFGTSVLPKSINIRKVVVMKDG
jgi:hypothetical protein